jgi:hypothetical protein
MPTAEDRLRASAFGVRTVDGDGALVRTARALGICLGDSA